MQSIVCCKICGQAHAAQPIAYGMVAKCRRCGSVMIRRTAGSLHMTAAFSLAALILYIPANIFPILRMDLYGITSQNTVWQGVVRLYKDHDYVISIIVFLASILIPLLKLLGLFFLVISTQLKTPVEKKMRAWIYKIIDIVGRWAMLDVFAVAILVSLVKLQRLATVLPGKALLAFGCVVVFTMLASASFDPQVIWNSEESKS